MRKWWFLALFVFCSCSGGGDLVSGGTPGNNGPVVGGAGGTLRVRVNPPAVRAQSLGDFNGVALDMLDPDSRLPIRETTVATVGPEPPVLTVLNVVAGRYLLRLQGLIDGQRVGAPAEQIVEVAIGRTTIVRIGLNPLVSSLQLSIDQSTLAVGSIGQLTAIAVAASGRGTNVTQSASYTSSNPAVASVDSQGRVLGLSPGQVTITASSGGRSASLQVTVIEAVPSSIVVQPANATTPVGASVSFTATGNFANGVTQNLTNSVTWSSNAAVATINSAGTATGVAPGTTQITASFQGVTGSASLAVSAAVAQSLAISPVATVAEGQNLQLNAVATFSDGTTANVAATFSVADVLIATTSPSGLLTGVMEGNTTVSAVFGTLNATAPVTVTAPLITALTIRPLDPFVSLGIQQQFFADATFADGTVREVTLDPQAVWVSSNPAVGSIDQNGLATALSPGQTTVTVTFGGLTASTLFQVGGGGASPFRGLIYSGQSGSNQVLVFNAAGLALGVNNVAPVAFANINFEKLFTETDNDKIYVAQTATSAVSSYTTASTAPTLGNTITGGASTVTDPPAVALGPALTFWVLNENGGGGDAEIRRFNLADTGGPAPVQTFSVTSAIGSTDIFTDLEYDAPNDILYIIGAGATASGIVRVPNATGAAGALTLGVGAFKSSVDVGGPGGTNLLGSFLDASTLYIAEGAGVASRIHVMNNAGAMVGPTMPARTITSAGPALVDARDVAITHGTLVVNDSTRILLFSNAATINGAVAPAAVIEGVATGINGPNGLAVDPTR